MQAFKDKFGNSPVWVRIIYPDCMLVPEWRLRVWYADALANGETAESTEGDPMNDELDYVIAQLSDIITFSKDYVV